MTTKAKGTKATKATKAKLKQVAKKTLVKWQTERKLSESVNHIPFLPPTMSGRRFVKRTYANRDHNWFGYDAFTVIGNLGPHVVPSHAVFSGKPYVFPSAVLVETESLDDDGKIRRSIAHVMQHEFLDLVLNHYDPA